MPATAVPSHEKMMLISGCAVSICAATSAVFAGIGIVERRRDDRDVRGQVLLERVDDRVADPPAGFVMIPTFCCPGRFAMLAATWAPCVG